MTDQWWDGGDGTDTGTHTHHTTHHTTRPHSPTTWPYHHTQHTPPQLPTHRGYTTTTHTLHYYTHTHTYTPAPHTTGLPQLPHHTHTTALDWVYTYSLTHSKRISSPYSSTPTFPSRTPRARATAAVCAAAFCNIAAVYLPFLYTSRFFHASFSPLFFALLLRRAAAATCGLPFLCTDASPGTRFCLLARAYRRSHRLRYYLHFPACVLIHARCLLFSAHSFLPALQPLPPRILVLLLRFLYFVVCAASRNLGFMSSCLFPRFPATSACLAANGSAAFCCATTTPAWLPTTYTTTPQAHTQRTPYAYTPAHLHTRTAHTPPHLLPRPPPAFTTRTSHTHHVHHHLPLHTVHIFPPRLPTCRPYLHLTPGGWIRGS